MQHEIFNNAYFTPRWHNHTLKQHNIVEFQELIWNFYNHNARRFAWREVHDPYHIVVSEIMLQQTQTHRVESKYQQFIIAFPHFQALAHASQKEVLAVWQGLGYNRRAVALHKIAQKVIEEYSGQLPANPTVLMQFPGIGYATASSICAFAFNKPTVFIETNIRAVFIHHFFYDTLDVHDNQILPLVEQTLVHDRARHWYYALMDYGVVLKKMFSNPSRKSKHHTRQSKFEGSDRQVRGMILKLLLEHHQLSHDELLVLLQDKINSDPMRSAKIITALERENLIALANDKYTL